MEDAGSNPAARSIIIWVWLSLVERSLRKREVAGSKPATQTNIADTKVVSSALNRVMSGVRFLRPQPDERGQAADAVRTGYKRSCRGRRASSAVEPSKYEVLSERLCAGLQSPARGVRLARTSPISPSANRTGLCLLSGESRFESSRGCQFAHVVQGKERSPPKRVAGCSNHPVGTMEG